MHIAPAVTTCLCLWEGILAVSLLDLYLAEEPSLRGLVSFIKSLYKIITKGETTMRQVAKACAVYWQALQRMYLQQSVVLV